MPGLAREDRVVRPYGVLPHLFVGRDALIAPPYNDPVSPVDAHQRQRRKRKVDASYKTKSTAFRKRAVYGNKFAQHIARPEVLKPSGFQMAFLGTFAATGKSTSPRRAKPLNNTAIAPSY